MHENSTNVLKNKNHVINRINIQYFQPWSALVNYCKVTLIG